MHKGNRISSLFAVASLVCAGAAQAVTPQAGRDYVEGLRYFTGNGVPQSYTQAAALYRRAAEQGHVSAQYALGLMHDLGYGVAADPLEAGLWYQRAAASGSDNARFRLSTMNAPRLAAAAYTTPGAGAPAALPGSPAPAFAGIPSGVAPYQAPASAGIPAGVAAYTAPSLPALPASAQPVSSYQAAVSTQDYVTALRALEAARAQGQAMSLGMSEAQISQELGRLAALSNDSALAQTYLQQAAALGSPEAQSALSALNQGAALSVLGNQLQNPTSAAALRNANFNLGQGSDTDKALNAAGLLLNSEDVAATAQALAVEQAKEAAKKKAAEELAKKVPGGALFGKLFGGD